MRFRGVQELLLGATRSIAARMLVNGKLKVAVIGMGKMGIPLALVFASKGAFVYGVDVDENKVELLNKGVNPIPWEPGVSELLNKALAEGRFKATTNCVDAVRDSDLIIVIVPVTASEKGINMFMMDKAMECIGRGLRRGSIIVTETTLPPGATESYIPLLEELSGLKAGVDFGIAHAPERTMSGRVIRDITESYPKIIGAINKDTLEPLIGVYSVINKKGVIAVSSIRVAEATKVFEGVYRDVNIALANELAIYGEMAGFDAIEAINAANTQPYCNIHKPGAGVGGHCIPVYPWFIIHGGLGLSSLTATARRVNSEMPRHIVNLTIKALNMAGRATVNSRVIVLGLSYRGGVKEHMNTPAIPIVGELEDWGCEVEVDDPLYSEDEIRKLGLKPFNKSFNDVDAIVIVTDHEEYIKLDLDMIANKVRTKVLVDGRLIFYGDKRTRKFFYAAPGVGVRKPIE